MTFPRARIAARVAARFARERVAWDQSSFPHSKSELDEMDSDERLEVLWDEGMRAVLLLDSLADVYKLYMPEKASVFLDAKKRVYKAVTEVERMRTASLRRIFAMSLEEAKEALGFKPDEDPSEADIQKAWKQMAFMFHPDRGGDVEVMKEVNVARDVLLGKQRPSSGFSPSPASPPSGGRGWTPQNEEKVTFDEAKSKANVPSGVNWRMKSVTAFGGYGDTHYMGYVVYGQTSDAHVFVSVHHYTTANAFTNSSANIYKMDTYHASKGALLDARDWDDVFKRMHSKFEGMKRGFNGKVEILPDSYKFDDKFPSGRVVNLKDAIEILGLSGAPVEDPLVTGRKLTVVMTLTRPAKDHDYSSYGVTLTINGRLHVLKEESAEMIRNRSKVLQLVFGNSWYSDSKKDLTRAKKGKIVMEWMSQRLTAEPPQLLKLLAAASAQIK